MKEISVVVCGDHWVNQLDVQHSLDHIDSPTPLLIKLNTEGPSLTALGIQQALVQYCDRTGTEHKSIYIDNWHNMVECCAFTRIHQPRISHFFWMSDQYVSQETLPWNREKIFGFFVGRATLPRSVMLWHLSLRTDCLLSVMAGSQIKTERNITVDTRQEWLAGQDVQAFDRWRKTCDIASLDSHAVRDQYDPRSNTNRDLVQHYHRFLIEISAETYTRGDAFFPTEKTVRPLLMGKALLAHAPRHYLARLKHLGFRTWHELWDESYDEHQGAERWALMRAVIDTIAHQDLDELLPQIEAIGAHNRARALYLADRYRP